MLWVLKKSMSMRRFFWAPKHMFKLMNKKILIQLYQWITNWVIFYASFLMSWFFSNQLLQKIIPGIPSECQTLGPNCPNLVLVEFVILLLWCLIKADKNTQVPHLQVAGMEVCIWRSVMCIGNWFQSLHDGPSIKKELNCMPASSWWLLSSMFTKVINRRASS